MIHRSAPILLVAALVGCAPAAPAAAPSPSTAPKAVATPAALKGVDMKYQPVEAGAIYTYSITRTKPGESTGTPRGTQTQTVGAVTTPTDALRWVTTIRTAYASGEAPQSYEATQEWRADGMYLLEASGRGDRLLPADPKVGEKWTNALFEHEVLALDGKAETPAGSYTGCLVVRSVVPKDGSIDESTYAPGVGYVTGTYTQVDGTKDVHALIKVALRKP